jgi:hypothetical protein
MAKDDSLGALIGFVGGLILGYALLKALTERPCPYCNKSTPKNQASCVHCGTYIGLG